MFWSRIASPPISVTPGRRAFRYFAFERSASQIAELDGLRGLAIILVVLRHAIRPFWDPNQPTLPVLGWDTATLMINGWIGVDLFFVLSGFLIASHIMGLNERWQGQWSWRPYLAKRVLRIVPAYYVVVLLAAFGAFPFYEVSPKFLALRIEYHLLFLQDYLTANIIVVFWSLGVEEKFYIVAPFVVLGIAKARALGLRTAGLALLLLVGVALRLWTYLERPEVTSYEAFFPVFRSPFHMTLDPILFGVLLAFLFRARHEVRWLTSKPLADCVFWVGFGILALLTTNGAMLDDISWWDKILQPFAIALAFAGMTYGLLFGGGPARLFRSAILFFFARVSYSLYLVHLALVPVSLVLTRELADREPEFVLFFPIYVLLSLVVALVLHYAVEKPFLIVKDRIR